MAFYTSWRTLVWWLLGADGGPRQFLTWEKCLVGQNQRLKKCAQLSPKWKLFSTFRPLTKVSSNVNEKDALTPLHLMYGRPITTLPYDRSADIINDPNYEPTPASLRESSIRQSKIMATFQRIYRRDFLTSLREYHQPASNSSKSEMWCLWTTMTIVNDDYDPDGLWL